MFPEFICISDWEIPITSVDFSLTVLLNKQASFPGIQHALLMNCNHEEQILTISSDHFMCKLFFPSCIHVSINAISIVMFVMVSQVELFNKPAVNYRCAKVARIDKISVTLVKVIGLSPYNFYCNTSINPHRKALEVFLCMEL